MCPDHEAAPARRDPLTIHCAYDALGLSFPTGWSPQIRQGFRFTIGWFGWSGVGKGMKMPTAVRAMMLFGVMQSIRTAQTARTYQTTRDGIWT
jgi:hypothetical protein